MGPFANAELPPKEVGPVSSRLKPPTKRHPADGIGVEDGRKAGAHAPPAKESLPFEAGAIDVNDVEIWAVGRGG